MTIPTLLTFRLIPSISTFRISFKPRLALATFFPLTVLCLVLDPTTTNSTMSPIRSLLRATWGLEIIAVVTARSVGQTTSIAKRVVSKNPVGILNFLRPGMTRDLTHELLASDKFGEFCNWFRMPLSKVEELTDFFINRGYLKPARSLLRRSEFRERSELFNTALYHLGTGVSFRTCQALCNISTSEVFLFFDTFLCFGVMCIHIMACITDRDLTYH